MAYCTCVEMAIIPNKEKSNIKRYTMELGTA
jgi:hypothetical protein